MAKKAVKKANKSLKKAGKEAPVKKAAEKAGKKRIRFSVYDFLPYQEKKFWYSIAAAVIVIFVAWRLVSMAPGIYYEQDTHSSLTGAPVQSGDTVKVMYMGTLEDGTEFDSGELEFTAGAGEMIQGFDEAVVGMKAGEEKTVTIPPEKAYGAKNDEMIIRLPFVFDAGKNITVTTTQFTEAFGTDAVAGETYEIDASAFPLKVIQVGGGNVVLERVASAGDVIPEGMEPWELEVVSVSDDYITLERKAVAGSMVITAVGQREVVVDGSDILLDMNHELAGKTLIFTIKLIESSTPDPMEAACKAYNTVKTDVPQFSAFIMSYCPYGLQMMKAMIPAAQLLDGKADVNLMFVDYIMHDKKEIDENNRMYCIQDEQPEVFWEYLKCFVTAGDSAGCLTSTGVDTMMMDACIARIDEEFMITELYNDKSTWNGGRYPQYNVQSVENGLYGVGGSPTVVINGQQVSVSRSPEDVKKAICCSFKTMPAECQQILSSAAASPGFGWDTTYDASTGGCGA